MKQTLTIVCKLNPTPEQAQKIERTRVAFAEACNYVNETVNPKIKNKSRIPAETYKEIRSQSCHRCLHIHPERGKSYRSGKSFKCGDCGWKGDADLNGANNLKRLGGVVTRLESTSLLSCSLRDRVTG